MLRRPQSESLAQERGHPGFPSLLKLRIILLRFKITIYCKGCIYDDDDYYFVRLFTQSLFFA